MKRKVMVKLIGQTHVPIYDFCHLAVIVTNDTEEAQRRLPKSKFPGVEPIECSGMSMWHRGQFAIIFDVNELDHELIGHEIFHVTGRIAKWCGIKYDVDNSEPMAFLSGWIHKFVYQSLRRSGYKVRG